MAVPVNLPAVQAVMDQLLALDVVRSCSMDGSELQSTPAVWVQLRGIDQTHLAASTLQLYVHLIVGDTDGGMRAAAELVDLYNAILAVVTPDGVTETEVVDMGDGRHLPALRLPLDVPNTPPA